MATRPEHWRDNEHGYGYISRFLHWSMAALFTWQFTSAMLRILVKDSDIAMFFWRTHHAIGSALFILALVRGLWGLFNLRRRPGHTADLLGRLATAGHLCLYLLMIAVPVLAIVRAYGRGRGFAPFGIQIFEPTGIQIPALMAPGNALHGVLGWVLLALIVGHIGMVLIHRYVWKDGITQRMIRG